MSACDWSTPGHDRYTGTVPAAIAAYRLPAATQAALIARFERREFDDAVIIDRDSIRGRRADYTPQLERMHFGSHGRICETVSRAGWTAEHVETALVVCADAVCVAWPAVCGNVSIVTRIARAAPLAPAYLDGADLIPGGPIGTGPGYAYAIPLAPAIAAPGGYGESWGAAAGFGYAIDYAPSACACCSSAAVAAVPEPMVWTLIAGGLGFVVAVARGKA